VKVHGKCAERTAWTTCLSPHIWRLPSGEDCAQVPLQPPEDAPVKTVNVTCWYWTGVARDEGDAAAEWLSAAIGQPARLVRYIGALAASRSGRPAIALLDDVLPIEALMM